MKSIINPRYKWGWVNEIGARLTDWHAWDNLLVRALTIAAGTVLFWLAVTVPLSLAWQTAFALGLLVTALILRRYAGSLVTLVLIGFSILASTRYLYWRVTETVGNGNIWDLIWSVGLVCAEIYAWMVLVLGYVQTAWPLKRATAAMPEDRNLWPTVDIFITVYNEPVKVLKTTVLAALSLDWPKDKLNIYVLDDGRREDIRALTQSVGVHYVTRPTNEHAKAGNLNNGLKHSNGEFIAAFDCDHVPASSFLLHTVGAFLKDRKLGIVQTPHHFFSPDPFERNLDTFKRVPNEGELFYGLVQDGNDFWNATFFCGSCAVLRRRALDDVGGIAVETVTEDAHTSLRMHRKGYTSAYINVAQAAGYATESLSAHVRQRIRWARGMAQIFRIDNPILGAGLRLGQRLCYANAMLHFFYGLPRLIFLTAPLAYLFFEGRVIRATALAIVVYALPHLFHAYLTNSRLQGPHRHSFWAEVYEATLAWYIFPPTLAALINPKLGKFDVTAKGGVVKEEYFDWSISKPYLFIFGLNVLGLGFGVVRLFWWNTHEADTVALNIGWTIYNLIIMGAAIAVALEARQRRDNPRITRPIPATLRYDGQSPISCSTRDYSLGGVALKSPAPIQLPVGKRVEVSLFGPNREFVFPARVVGADAACLRLHFDDLSLQQEKDLVQCTFARADAWTNRSEGRAIDRPIYGMREIIMHSLVGVAGLLAAFAAAVRGMFGLAARPTSWLRKWLIGLKEEVLLRQEKGRERRRMPRVPVAAMLMLIVLIGVALAHRSAYAAEKVSAAEPAGAPRTHSYTLKQLGAVEAATVRGVEGAVSYPLSVRADEVVTSAKLRLRYAYSPALIPEYSHIRVLVNNEVAAVLPVPREQAAGVQSDVTLDPKLFSGYNQLTLQLIGHYTRECEDPLHTSLWATFGNQSRIELTVSPLGLHNDLSILPLPFFDARDPQPLNLPMVFGTKPDHGTLQAAAMVASYFGALADYRGARFPAYLGKLPSSHAIVFALKDDVPAGINVGPIDGPTIAMASHPTDVRVKLLLVMGRDVQELRTAAMAFSLGQPAMAGAAVLVKQLDNVPPRKPYDAPRWIPSDRPVKFAELADSGQLQARGLFPDVIKVGMRVAPDKFTWYSRGVPMDVRYRYTPRTRVDQKSTLNVSINDFFLRSLPLQGTDVNAGVVKVAMTALQGGGTAVGRETIDIPASQIAPKSQLQFKYYFDYVKEGPCKDALLDNDRGAVDPESSIDFSAFPHYAAMPNLASFATAGFPFTRMADLSETAVVLPDTLGAEDIEALLTLFGRMGESTGYPATGVALVKAAEVQSHANKDLLVIGSPANQPLLAQWAQHMPLAMDGAARRVRMPAPVERLVARWEGRDLDEAVRRAADLSVRSDAGMSVMMAFQSPLQKGRSVVVVATSDAKGLPTALATFFDPEHIHNVKGDLAIPHGKQINGLLVGETYHVGNLPLWTSIRWFLSKQPILLVIMAFIAAILAAVLGYRWFRRKAAERLDSA
jgi:cellulose synthase (UDP-forming)